MRIVQLSMLFCFLTGQLCAQGIEPTTEKEFNYITVGYKIQLQAGLPMKEGYSLSDMGRYEVPDCVVEMKALTRKGEAQPCAFMLVYTEIREEPVYFCVPTPDASQDLWERYYKSLIPDLSNHSEKLRYMLFGVSKMWMKNVQAGGDNSVK